MSKKYVGKTCIYCLAALSTGADHVVAREFFGPDVRGGLPKVPACAACNSKKNRLEMILTAIIPLACQDPESFGIESQSIFARLNNNDALRRDLFARLRPAWQETPTGLLVPTVMFDGYTEEFVELFGLIVRGLVYHEWKVALPLEYGLRVGPVPADAQHDLRLIIESCRPEMIARRSYAAGGFSYVAARNDADPGMSMWELTFYDGAQMRTQRNGRLEPLYVFAITNPPRDFDAAVS